MPGGENMKRKSPPASDASHAARDEETSLLQRLRRRQLVVHPTTTEDEAKQKQKLILDHRSEFPSKLRCFIQKGSKLPPEIFLRGIYEALKKLFLRLPHSCHMRIDLPWDRDFSHGLDAAVDTEEEVELAIRFFPELLKEQYSQTSTESFLYLARPIHMLLTFHRAVSFVPLFLRLGEEMGFDMGANNFAEYYRFEKMEEGVDHSNYRKYVLRQLLVDQFSVLHDKFPDFHSDIDRGFRRKDLRDESLAVLKRLRDEGMVTEEDLYDCDLLLWMMQQVGCEILSFEEFTERLDILIEWNPCLLEDCGTGTTLIEEVASCHEDGADWDDFFPYLIYEIFELGMQYSPVCLGYIHHMYTTEKCNEFTRLGFSPHVRITSNLLHHCSQYGVEDAESFHYRIKEYVTSHPNPMEDFVSYVAKDVMISVEGLYTLVRLDPIASIRALQKLEDNDGNAVLETGEPAAPA